MNTLQGFYQKNEKIILVVVLLISALTIYISLMKEKLEVEQDVEERAVEEQEQEEKTRDIQAMEQNDEHHMVEENEFPGQGEIKPSDLLPMSQEVVNFTQQFPDGKNEVKGKNFLVAGHNIGINTVSSSLKNANLQIRSDPYIPRKDTGPWGQSTIMSSDLTNRKTLEIGTTM